MVIKRALGLALLSALALLNSISISLSQGLPPLPPQSPVLDSWRFDNSPFWWSVQDYPPLAFTNIQAAPSFQGDSVQVDAADAFLQYAILQDDDSLSLGIPSGSIFIWAQPNWTSASASGAGPGDWASLLSAGSYGAGGSNAWLSLLISPDGNTLVFASATNENAAVALLAAPISWNSNQWHSVIVGYDENSSYLALDGVIVTNGLGIELGNSVISNAFYVGSAEGYWQFHGQLDLLQTWDRPATVDEVTNYYSGIYNDFFASTNAPGGIGHSPGSSGESGFSSPDGFLPLQTCGCVTNGPAYLTNLYAVITNNLVNFSFCVLGGTNGIPYDLWSAPSLAVTNHFASAWTWLGTVNTCTNYLLTNQSLSGSFYWLSANPEPCYPDAQVMFVIDRSTNMVDTTPSNNLQLAQYCASNIIHRLNLSNYDSAGLVSWSSNVATNQLLTNNLITLSNAIASITNVGGQNTDTSNAIAAAQAELTGIRRDPRAKPIIVFMSEGLNNNVELSNTQKTNITAAAKFAKSLGTRFVTLALGKDADTNFLATLASSPGDFYWGGLTNTPPLTNVFTAIDPLICRYTNAPSIQITNPTNGFVFIDGTNLPLAAAVSVDRVLSVSNVQFFADGVNIGTVSTAPFDLTWSNVPPGSHLLSAKITDSSGTTALSQYVGISDQAILPPNDVSITSPTNGQLFVLTPTNIVISAAYSGPGLSALALYNGSTKLVQSATSPCQYLWTNAPAGVFTLTAQATNSFGTPFSASITITNNAPPTVSINSPTNLQTFVEVTNVAISGNFSDPDGSVTNVALYSGTNLIAAFNPSGATNFTLVWSNRPAGAFPLMAIATDNRGALGYSSNKVFLVNSTNLPPAVAITYPTNGQVFAAGSDITIIATASATNGAVITNVAFFSGTNLLGNDPASPYSITECCWSSGTYVLTAKAVDSQGASIVSTPVSITVGPSSVTSGGGFWDPLFGNPGFDVGQAGSSPALAMMTQGSNLYVSGWIPGSVGDTTFAGVAKWDGTSWTSIGSVENEFDAVIHTIAADGTNIYVAGDVPSGETKYIARWDGAQWVLVGTNELEKVPIEGQINALLVMGSDLYAGGDFNAAANGSSQDTNVQYIARYNASTLRWESVGNGLNGPVYALASIGNRLFAGGTFTNAGGNTNATFIAELAGNVWTNLGSGVGGTNSWGQPGAVFALSACGSNLFVGGEFTSAGGNTNANGIARWDGHNWSDIGGGLSGSDLDNSSGASQDGFQYWQAPGFEDLPIASVRVFSIVASGNTIYVGGEFGAAGQGTNQITAKHIAKAVWSEANQSWSWTDLDRGVCFASGGDDYVAAVALLPGPTPDSYDVFVGGWFDSAGSAETSSQNIARWSVGRAYPAVAVSVTVNSPAYNAVFTNTAPINFSALVTAGTNAISQVEFFVDGTSIGVSSCSANPYTNVWSAPTPGPHAVTAVVTDQSAPAHKASSKSVIFNVTTSGSGLTANNDVFTVLANSLNNYLPVLTNDVSGSPMKITGAGPYLSGFSGNKLGTVSVSQDAQNLLYTPVPNLYGTNVLYYDVTNSAGAAGRAFVTVQVLPQPTVQITIPANGSVFSNTASVTIAGAAISLDGSISGVNLYTNGLQYGSTLTVTASNTYSATWSQTIPGFYTFTAVATDSFGLTNVSSPVTIAVTNDSTSTNVLTAAITWPSPAVTNLNGYPITNATLIRDGVLTNLTGSAYDSNPADQVSYQILLLDPVNPNLTAPLYNVTPFPRDGQGFHDGAVTNGALGLLDLSGVENGSYLLTLLVRGGGKETSTSLLIAVASNLKLGQFSFSQQDLTLPVNGLPLTLTRTYNSINPRSADFGYGWTFALNSMDVQLDEQRISVTIGSDAAPFADVEEDANGLPLVVSMRSGGSRDVTLTLPDGRRTTFAFNPRNASDQAYAQWTPPPEIGRNITLTPNDSGLINFFPALGWQSAPEGCTFDAYDVPGWTLTTQDGTQYQITRGAVNNVWYDASGDGSGDYVQVPVYGPPQLTEVDEPTGDKLFITPNSVYHQNSNGFTTRAITMDRDGQGRITAIYDPVSQAAGPQSSTLALQPGVRYLYDNDSGNLVQVLKLVDRAAGTYVTNKYHYDNPQFPHYITSIDDANGATPVRTLYNDAGQMVGTIDALGNTNTFAPSAIAQSQTVIDALGNTNTYYCDSRGNVTTIVDALGHVTQKAYDTTNNVIMTIDALSHTNLFGYDSYGNQTASTNALGYTNGATFDPLGHMLTSTDARGFTTRNGYDQVTGNLLATTNALQQQTSYAYDPVTTLLVSTTDPLNNVTTNGYDEYGNQLFTAILSAGTGAILASNSFAYDANGNRTNSTVWRRVNGVWVGASTTYILDAQNRVTQTINPDGGTNTVVYDNNGRQIASIDPLGHQTSYVLDDMGRQIAVLYPDGSSTGTAYDSNGRQIATTNQLGYVTQNFYDAVGQQIYTVYPDLTTNWTVFDQAGRVQFTIDARGTTNGFGYDATGQEIAVTNALGKSEQAVTLYGLDPNGNQIFVTNALGNITTNVFDGLNRSFAVWYPDGTKTGTAFDAAGRRVAETNQDGIVTLFGLDGAGQLISVTNAFGTAQQIITYYVFDEAGNEVFQIDALGRTNTFVWDQMNRRVLHIMPAGQSEGFGFDLAGNQIVHTNFNGVVITNQFDLMNRMTNRASIGGYQIGFSFTPTGQRATMTDASGQTTFVYDTRDRLTTNATPEGILYYARDRNGNVTNIWSSTPNGVNLVYQLDSMNRITNVLDHGAPAAGYLFDRASNLRGTLLGNGITNISQFDVVNHLTNMVWKSNALTIASFSYQLGLTGNRTNLSESLPGAQRTYSWALDKLYRLTNETISASSGPTGTLGYALDSVGNRLSRTGGIGSLGAQSFGYSSNDWLTNDLYDANGSTTNSSGHSYKYDVENRLTNYDNGAELILYNGDGSRVRTVVGGVTTVCLVDSLNPSGYEQVLEESTVSGSATNLSRRYAFGPSIISQTTTNAGSSTTLYFIADAHGSTRLLLGTDGSLENVLAFDSYSTIIASNSPPQTMYLYSGEQFDPTLGFYYLRARYLSLNTGRFWTRDAYEGDQQNPLSLHKYVYGADDPINLDDPSGHWPSQKGWWVHQQAIDQALSFLSAHDRDIIKRADAAMDEPCYQTSWYSYIHAMSSPDHTVSQARLLANSFVRDQLIAARKAQAAGNHDAALSFLGSALHTLQDSTSPAHCDFQYWDGTWSETSPQTLTHIATELYHPAFDGSDIFGSALYKMTVQGYGYFKSKGSLPQDFFWFWPQIPPRVSISARLGIAGLENIDVEPLGF